MTNLEELIERAQSGALTVAELTAMPRGELLEIAEEVQKKRQAALVENQLMFYRPVGPEAVRFHLSTTQQRIILGGNGSSKSEAQLVDLVIEMTGIIPACLQDSYPREKLRVPISGRLIVESFKNTWPKLREKLQWDHWTGLKDGIRGHWGWIPRRLLLKGSWDESWSEKESTLRLTNGSTLQIMSHDQEVEDMASASLHRIAVDEGPSYREWRENLMRLREGGSISLAMTPPDDKSKSWHAAWVYDELFEKGQAGPNKDPDIDSFRFRTRDNQFIDQEAMARATKGFSTAERATRLDGEFIHLGGLVYPVYTDVPRVYCFTCNEKTGLLEGLCAVCGGSDVCEYNHVVPVDQTWYRYPVVFLVDPHPRKPIMMIWVAIDPYDDAAEIAELEVGGNVKLETVRDRILELEKSLGLNIVARIMDSKMKGQAAHNAGQRGVTVGDAWDQVGIRCKGADNDFMVGKTRLNSLLAPDERTRKPRFVVFDSCPRTNYMFKHFVWDEYVHQDGKDEKQAPKTLNDDFPALVRYFANEGYSYRGIHMGMSPQSATGKRKRRAAYG